LRQLRAIERELDQVDRVERDVALEGQQSELCVA
jgi:hypothetical protein